MDGQQLLAKFTEVTKLSLDPENNCSGVSGKEWEFFGPNDTPNDMRDMLTVRISDSAVRLELNEDGTPYKMEGEAPHYITMTAIWGKEEGLNTHLSVNGGQFVHEQISLDAILEAITKIKFEPNRPDIEGKFALPFTIREPQ